MRGVARGQLSLELFDEQKREPFDYANVEHVTNWLVKTHHCTEAVRPYVLGLYAEFDESEAFERCKVLPSLDGLHCIDGWCLQDAIDYYQIYSHALDYHTIWDRAQAARSGMTKDDVLAVIEWDYSKHAPINGKVYACDTCRNGVWHRNGDGYFCCIAPGMGHINAKQRKEQACKFYQRRDCQFV